MQPMTPTPEHDWLHGLLGEWSFEYDCHMGPDQPPTKIRGTESVRSLGGLWVLCEGKGDCPGVGLNTTQMTLGYDPARKRFVGTFVASMMTHLWIYDGNRAGNVLTLDSIGPSFTVEGQMDKYQDIIEIKGPDRRTLTAQLLGPDGKWVQIMVAEYRRTSQ